MTFTKGEKLVRSKRYSRIVSALWSARRKARKRRRPGLDIQGSVAMVLADRQRTGCSQPALLI